MEYMATETRVIRMLSDDTVEIVFYDNAVLTPENALEDSRVYDEFTKKKRLKKLVVTGLYTKADLDTRKFIAQENLKRSSKIIAEAIVVKTPLLKVAASIYQFFLKQRYPCKIFQSRDKAIEWLKLYK